MYMNNELVNIAFLMWTHHFGLLIIDAKFERAQHADLNVRLRIELG